MTEAEFIKEVTEGLLLLCHVCRFLG
jgi:hypothetical protein